MKESDGPPFSAGSRRSHSPSLLAFARVVRPVDIDDLPRARSMELNDSLRSCHGVVMHRRLEPGKAARRERVHLRLIELITHTNLEIPADHSDVFTAQVMVGRNLVTRRHL